MAKATGDLGYRDASRNHDGGSRVPEVVRHHREQLVRLHSAGQNTAIVVPYDWMQRGTGTLPRTTEGSVVGRQWVATLIKKHASVALLDLDVVAKDGHQFGRERDGPRRRVPVTPFLCTVVEPGACVGPLSPWRNGASPDLCRAPTRRGEVKVAEVEVGDLGGPHAREKQHPQKVA
jgi:hypothetical protein